MKKVCIHVHVYYPDRWEEIKQYIKNLEDYDLYVTVSEQIVQIEEKIQEEFPDAVIFSVPNKGYDIAPFLYVLKQVNLDDYAFLLKLHTKRTVPEGEYLNRYLVSGDRWKNYLLEPFASAEQMNKNYTLFVRDEKLGCLTHYKCIMPFKRDKFYDAFLAYHQIEKMPANCVFVAGSMFLARAFLLKPLQDFNYAFEDFEVPQKNSFQLAHYLERYFGYCVCQQGYTIKPYDYDKKYTCLLRKIRWNLAKFFNYYEQA